MRIKKLELEARVNMLTEKVSREVGRLVRPTWNPVREWKRRACEVLGVVVPPGHAPECLNPQRIRMIVSIKALFHTERQGLTCMAPVKMV